MLVYWLLAASYVLKLTRDFGQADHILINGSLSPMNTFPNDHFSNDHFSNGKVYVNKRSH